MTLHPTIYPKAKDKSIKDIYSPRWVNKEWDVKDKKTGEITQQLTCTLNNTKERIDDDSMK